MSEAIRFGIIGIGNMGKGHCGNLQAGKVSGAVLGAICDTDPSFKGQYDVPFFSSHQEMIASGAVDILMIATPHYDHTPIAIAGLEAGLHVLVEKPMAVHVADARRMIAAYEARPNKDQIFAEMLNQRTIPAHKKIRSLIQSGELGEVRRIQWTITNWFRSQTYYNSGGWRATWQGEGGGVLLNQCPHNLDLWQWFFGMPSKIRSFCSLGRYHDIEVEDDVTTYMEYANGTTGVFISSTGEAPGTNRLEIAAERGRLVFENGAITFQRNEIEMSEFCRTSKSGFGAPPSWKCEIPAPGQSPQHVGIMQNVVDAILGKDELLAPAVEGINGVELANAMLYSSAMGESVDLPIDAAAYEAHLQKLIANSTVRKTVVEKQDDASFANSY